RSGEEQRRAPARGPASDEQDGHEAGDTHDREQQADELRPAAEALQHQDGDGDEKETRRDVAGGDAEAEEAQRGMTDDVHQAVPRVPQEASSAGAPARVAQAARGYGRGGEDAAAH